MKKWAIISVWPKANFHGKEVHNTVDLHEAAFKPDLVLFGKMCQRDAHKIFSSGNEYKWATSWSSGFAIRPRIRTVWRQRSDRSSPIRRRIIRRMHRAPFPTEPKQQVSELINVAARSKEAYRPQNVAQLSEILWPVGAPNYRPLVRPNTLNMPKFGPGSHLPGSETWS